MAGDPLARRPDGDAMRLRAEALGEPSRRRFRLLAIIDRETHIVWLEKEQLRRLGQALAQVLENLPKVGPDLTSTNSMLEFDLETRSQFRAGRMELGYDEGRDRILVIAHEIEADADEPAALSLRITRAQAREIAEESEIVVSAGRPLCPLCSRPMGPEPHVCAKQNGHFPKRLEEVQGEEADA